MSEHTPGPWFADEHGNNVIYTEHGQEIAEVYYFDSEREKLPSECLANEYLIAAAPELLAALEEIVKEYGNADNGRTLRWAIDGAKEAIAKAKGEE